MKSIDKNLDTGIPIYIGKDEGDPYFNISDDSNKGPIYIGKDESDPKVGDIIMLREVYLSRNGRLTSIKINALTEAELAEVEQARANRGLQDLKTAMASGRMVNSPQR